MAAATMTEYERQRLENIRRNDEVMASLMIRRKASDIATDIERSAAQLKKPKKEKEKTKKPRAQTPIVVRRSLRHRGLPPDPSLPFADYHPNTPPSTNDSPASTARKREALHIGDAFLEGSNSSDRHLLKMIKSASDRQSAVDLGKGVKEDLLDPKRDLTLREENVKRLLAGRVLSVRFLPFRHRSVIVAGDKLGHVGFWDVDAVEGEGDGLFVYAPHSAPVSGISVHPFSSAKIFTCSYDGLIRLMDVRNETYHMIYSSNYLIYSICQSPDSVSSICFGEGAGELKLWDERAGKVSNTWDLHEQRINTIDFHPENTNMVATSSTDGLACIWDLRKLKKHQSESLNTIEHKRAVHSAYFSPGGIYLATTSIDDTVGILKGVNSGDLSLVKHDNQTGRWLSSFRAIWGWDDSYLLMGNMKRAIDVISTDLRTTTALVSDYMTSIPCRFAAHPYNIGSLAGTTAAGKVFYWTRK